MYYYIVDRRFQDMYSTNTCNETSFDIETHENCEE